MKSQLQVSVVALLAATSLCAVGCAGSGERPSLQDRYSNYSDPCWPERYNTQSRKVVMDTMAAQVANGHDVDQTIANYHFEAASAELNPAGRAKLDYLMRRRPVVDGNLVLQTARDLAFDPTNPEQLANKRAELDAQRINSIRQYVTASTSGRGISVDVTVKDPADMFMDANGPSNSVRGLSFLYSSGITGAVSGGVVGAGGGGAPMGAAAAGGVPGGAPGGAPQGQQPPPR